MNCQILSSGKKRIYVLLLSSAEFVQKVVNNSGRATLTVHSLSDVSHLDVGAKYRIILNIGTPGPELINFFLS